MTALIKTIFNCETGEVIERPFTADEIAQREIDTENYNKQLLQEQAEAQAKAEAKASALAKLTALGLTEEEAAALIS